MQPVKQSWILTGGFLSAVAASLCCIGPLVAAVEGGANIGTFIWGGIGVVLIVAGRVVDAIRARG